MKERTEGVTLDGEDQRRRAARRRQEVAPRVALGIAPPLGRRHQHRRNEQQIREAQQAHGASPQQHAVALREQTHSR